jgi:hypothetical protein
MGHCKQQRDKAITMKLMEWFNVNEHTDVVSWKPFFISGFLTLGSYAMQCVEAADVISSIVIKLGQVVTVVLAVYIAGNNAHAIYKKNQEEKRERKRNSN